MGVGRSLQAYCATQVDRSATSWRYLLSFAHWAGSGHLLNGCRWQARRTVPAPGVITSSRFQLYSRDQVSGDELAIPALGGSSAMQVGGYRPQFRPHRGVICPCLLRRTGCSGEPFGLPFQITLRCGLVLGRTRCSGSYRQADGALVVF